MSDQIKVVIRPFVDSDRNFVIATWLKGNYFGNSFFRQMPQNLYFEKYADHIQAVMSSQESHISIACDQDNETWIVGFAVFEKDNLHWCHVKEDYRKKGIATLLLKGRRVTEVKSTTKIGRAITEIKGLIFNPLN